MKTLALALAATMFTWSPHPTTFDANKTAMISGFQIICPKGEKGHTVLIKNGLEVCPGVKLIAPPEIKDVKIQYMLFY